MSSVKNLAQLFESSSHSSLPTPPPSPYPYRQKKINVTEKKQKEKPLDLVGANRKKLIEGLKLQLSSSKKPSEVKASTKELDCTIDKDKSTVNANVVETRSPPDQSKEKNKKEKLEKSTVVNTNVGETHSPLDQSEERNKRNKLESKDELSSPPKTHRRSNSDFDIQILGENSTNEIAINDELSPKPLAMTQNLGNQKQVIEELQKEKQTHPESQKKKEPLRIAIHELSVLVGKARHSFLSCKKKGAGQLQVIKENGIRCCTSTKQIVVEAYSISFQFLRKLRKVYAKSFQIYCSSTPSTAKIALAILLTSFICSLHPTVPRGSTPLLAFTYIQASTKVSFKYMSSFPFDI